MSTTEHSSDMLAAARAYAYGQQAAQLSAATTQVRERMLANTEGGDPIRVAAEELSAALLTGQPIPDDFDQNLDRLLAAEARRVARAKVLELALANLRVARDDLARSGADRALTWLGHQLAAIIATVTETEPALNGITTADQAMDAGSEAVTAWQMLTKAATGYRQIRTAQAELVAEARNDRYGAIRSIYTAGLTRTLPTPAT